MRALRWTDLLALQLLMKQSLLSQAEAIAIAMIVNFLVVPRRAPTLTHSNWGNGGLRQRIDGEIMRTTYRSLTEQVVQGMPSEGFGAAIASAANGAMRRTEQLKVGDWIAFCPNCSPYRADDQGSYECDVGEREVYGAQDVHVCTVCDDSSWMCFRVRRR